MEFVKYLKGCVWDLILCAVMAVSLCYAEGSGFYVAESLHKNYVLLLGIVVLTTAVLAAISYNKKTLIFGISGIAAALVLLFLVLGLNSGIGNVFADKPGNPWLYVTLMITTTVGVYLLSRTRIGTCGLLAAGILVMAVIQFLYKPGHLAALFLFLCACGSMYIFKNYQRNVVQSQTVKTAFGRTFVISAVLSVLLLSLGAGIFYGIVKPLDPPARELKLITKYMSFETLQELGIASEVLLTDPDQFTQKTDDTEKTAKQEGDKKKDNPDKGNKGKDQDKSQNKQDNQVNRLDKNDSSQVFYAIKYTTEKISPVWWILMLLLLIVLAVVLKLWLRDRWFRKVKEQPKKEQVQTLYRYYLKKFALMGVKKQKEDTPLEFAEKAASQLEAFEESGVSIRSLTETFVGAAYSPSGVSEQGYKAYLSFHKVFYSCCRKHLGKLKYMLKFFRI